MIKKHLHDLYNFKKFVGTISIIIKNTKTMKNNYEKKSFKNLLKL